jgi:hypothetical protein
MLTASAEASTPARRPEGEAAVTLRWKRTVESVKQWLLLDRPDESLWRGDIIRLAHDPSLGPCSPTADYMLYELWGYDDRLGLLKLDGYKAGLPMLYFPVESQGTDGLCLQSSWLIASWDRWMCYFTHPDGVDPPIPLPIGQTVVIRRPQHMPDLNL